MTLLLRSFSASPRRKQLVRRLFQQDSAGGDLLYHELSGETAWVEGDLPRQYLEILKEDLNTRTSSGTVLALIRCLYRYDWSCTGSGTLGASLSAVEKMKSEDANCLGQQEQKRRNSECLLKQNISLSLVVCFSFEDKFQSLVPCLSRSTRLLAAAALRIEAAISISL